MKITLDDYIKNPMGEGSSVFTQREIFRNLYSDKFDKLMVREVGKIIYHLYREDDGYVAHFRIPSEAIANFYYDVILEFTSKDTAIQNEKTLKNYNVKFFSNDPAFTYTFAHAFLKQGLLIKDLEPKMIKATVTDVAKVKNPKSNIGYVKTIYFAYLYMKLKGMFNKSTFDTYCKKYNMEEFLKTIEPADLKVESRVKAAEVLLKSKQKLKNDNRAVHSNNRDLNHHASGAITKTPNSKTTAKTKTVKFTKTSKKR